MVGKVIRIGGAGGFLGDSQVAATQLLESGALSYVVLDYLAEATMSLLARSKSKNAEAGYARDFTDWVWKDSLHLLKSTGTKVVTNAGGLNPRDCRDRMVALAKEQGLSFRIAIVEGSDLIGRLDELSTLKEMASGAPFPPHRSVTSANAYLGATPIVAALAAGADVVITGRVVDSALVLAPLIHEFGWELTDFDLLAAGSLAGHILECGAQATGGLFTDWETVPDWAHIGYPIAECAADGSFVVTKCDGTGGICTPATIAEQILYEIADPQNYQLPDVICDFSQVSVAAVGPDRVRIMGARGRAPSGKYKVCITFEDGWRTMAVTAVLGRGAARKAERQSRAIVERCEELLRKRNIGPFRSLRIETLGSEVTYGAQAQAQHVREVVCKTGVEHDDPEALKLFLREIESPVTSMAVGTTGWFAGRPMISPVVRVFSTLIERAQVVPHVVLEGQEIPVPPLVVAAAMAVPRPILSGTVATPTADVRVVPLIDLAWARSGDKGNGFNIGVIARRPEFLPYIRGALSETKVAEFFAHEFDDDSDREVKRYELPGLIALNFVFSNALGGGQMASLRVDPLAKGKAQQLLEFPIPVPQSISL